MPNDIPNHEFRDGARPYPGHTGSPLDEPSKALKAGAHGVPGGENMIAFPDGSFRYYTAREAARIQTFPDDYVFAGAWTESMRQIGNAVPVLLAETVGQSIVTSTCFM
jgi:DNA (cytosine-5)-methyltransferase 1